MLSKSKNYFRCPVQYNFSMGTLLTNISLVLHSYGNQSLNLLYKSSDVMQQKQHLAEMDSFMPQTQEKD